MVVKKTRKQNHGKGKTMTIPQLRRAFEHMEKFRDVDNFRKEWKKVFGKEISKTSAEDYLKYVSSKKDSKQHGGMAPLDYTTRPGADLPYGSFNQYVSSGFGFANQDSLMTQCGKETHLWPSPLPGSGSNVVGGGKRSKRKTRKQKGGALPSLSTAVSEFMSRPFGMNSPPNSLQDASLQWKGVDSLPSPRPEINDLKYTHNPTIYNASISPIVRTF